MLAELGRSSGGNRLPCEASSGQHTCCFDCFAGNAASGQHNSDEESTCLQSRGPRDRPEGALNFKAFL